MKSLRELFFRYFLTLIAILVLAVSVLFYFQYKTLFQFFVGESIDSAKSIAINLEATVLFESLEDFQDLTRNLNFYTMEVVKGDRVFARNGFYNYSFFKDINENYYYKNGKISIRTPILSQGSTIGTLYVTYEDKKLKKLIYDQCISLSIFGIVFFVLLLLLRRHLIVAILKPISTLSNSFKEIIVKNDLSIRIQDDQKIRETKILVESFNSLLLFLEVNAQKLDSLNKNLENKVREKTISLEDALTNLKEAQSSIVAQEKLASLGGLTAGIAHEIKNPLNLIIGSSTLIKDILVPDLSKKLEKGKSEEVDYESMMKKFTDVSELITINGRRIDSIIKSMLLLARSGDASFVQADLGEHIERALDLAYHSFKARQNFVNVNIDKEIPRGFTLMCLPQDIERAFINILDNIFFALNVKHNGKGTTASLKISLREVDNDYVIRLEDNGIGMSEETLQKVFEPFYTTKDPGQGTGLGMSIVNDIVTAHKGKLNVTSTLDVGTTIEIHFKKVSE
ncbi:sensor histidine kinase [Bacteriovorax sp. Seq25_V]|uniref:sensor histidine kinase n=1 Tax=Bacteriovorax sp. Seq25_V TaxID=1201288 RepID=UPI00038A24A8|nr:ATP-binding protein [Bacteriovorax sp. Seq25_V]EQC47571.1 GHKL domain protein [Bacteriovorax sp. Seq25_V]